MFYGKVTPSTEESFHQVVDPEGKVNTLMHIFDNPGWRHWGLKVWYVENGGNIDIQIAGVHDKPPYNIEFPDDAKFYQLLIAPGSFNTDVTNFIMQFFPDLFQTETQSTVTQDAD